MAPVMEQSPHIDIGVLQPLQLRGQVRVEDFQIDHHRVVIEDGVEKADQDRLALDRAKDLFEGKIRFGIDESHARFQPKT